MGRSPNPGDRDATVFAVRTSVEGRRLSRPVGDGGLVAGSGAEAGLRLTGRGISRRHARFYRVGGELWVEDLDSKNGVWLGERRIDRTRVDAGALVRIGDATLEVSRVHPDDARVALALPGESPLDSPALDSATERLDGGGAASPREARAVALRLPAGFVAGPSPAMAGLFEELARAAPEQAPVLLLGETGSGKELVARALHASSPRAAGPFLALNCAAIPPDLLEADVFGVARGAATGVVARPGIFQRAEGGTLLLDEIGELPPPLQAKLLRALEERQVTPVGGMPQATDVRVVAATHRDLDAEIAAGRFRPDLYYRLAAFVLRVPPLRDRREDMPALVAELVSRFARASGRRIGGVSARALAALEAYSWPGNVRELEHETRRWVASCPDGGVVDSSMLDPRILATAAAPASPAAASPEARFDLEAHLARAERELIVRALAEAKGNRTRAAAWLGISRNGLAAKIARHGLEEPPGGD